MLEDPIVVAHAAEPSLHHVRHRMERDAGREVRAGLLHSGPFAGETQCEVDMGFAKWRCPASNSSARNGPQGSWHGGVAMERACRSTLLWVKDPTPGRGPCACGRPAFQRLVPEAAATVHRLSAIRMATCRHLLGALPHDPRLPSSKPHLRPVERPCRERSSCPRTSHMP